MKIFVTGTRGIPDIPGGVESHCQYLYPLIIQQGHEVKLSRRKPYVDSQLSEWSGIDFVDNYAPMNKSFEAIVHTFVAILEAKKWKADIIHIHAIGPAIMVPFARLLGMNVVLTHHGPDYDRNKWGRLAKLVLKTGEKLGCIFSNEIIVISEVIQKLVKDNFNRESNLIYNGVQVVEKSKETTYIDKLGLNPNEYILTVARFVPEKGLHDLIQAFNESELPCKLVLAGDSDHEDEYSLKLKSMAKENANVILTGYITGDPLHQLFSHAKLFVLPSYHEGLPISLLEALSYGLPVLVSNINANKEVGLPEDCYFPVKNVDILEQKLVKKIQGIQTIENINEMIGWVKKKYNWNKIAIQTVDVYVKIVCSVSNTKISKDS